MLAWHVVALQHARQGVAWVIRLGPQVLGQAHLSFRLIALVHLSFRLAQVV